MIGRPLTGKKVAFTSDDETLTIDTPPPNQGFEVRSVYAVIVGTVGTSDSLQLQQAGKLMAQDTNAVSNRYVVLGKFTTPRGAALQVALDLGVGGVFTSGFVYVTYRLYP